MEAGWPKPPAGSVHDSPTPQEGTLLLGLKVFNPRLYCLADARRGAVDQLRRGLPAQGQAALRAIALDPVPLFGFDLIAIRSGARACVGVLKPRLGVEQLRRRANNVVCPHVLAVDAIEMRWRPERRRR